MILFVDDEEELRRAAAQTLMLAGLEVSTHAGAEEALAQLSPAFPGVLVTDIRMRGQDGLWLMRQALERDPQLPVILITGHGDVPLAVSSMREGAFDFLEKPFDPDRMVTTVQHALAQRRLVLENRALRQAVEARDPLEAQLIGRSDAAVALRRSIRAIAGTDADLLIIGETGTGKGLSARAIHDLSTRADQPFVHINCAALPEHLVESELFGHEAGAFPGAMRTRYGKFEHARRGTLFLDEIDCLPVPVQAKLLHVVQERRVTRLGANEPVALDIRIIAAAKNDLAPAVAAGGFRADLLYRLNVVTLAIPPLAQRRGDIPLLFLALAAQAARRHDRPLRDVPAEVLARIATRDWPGNVRELGNAAERFVLGLGQEDLPGAAPAPEPGRSLSEQMAAHERALIAATLTAKGGSLKQTYEALGLSRKALYEKMQKHGITRDPAPGA